MTITDLITAVEAEKTAAEQRRETALSEARAVIDTAKREGRTALTDDEDATIGAALERRNTADADLTKIAARLAQYVAIRDEDAAVDKRMNTVDPNPPAGSVAARPSYDQVARVGREEAVYHAGNDRRGTAFLRDVGRQYLFGDPKASERLSRHMAQEQDRFRGTPYLERAAGTGAFAGLTVPQYLTDMYAPAVAALRPFADACNRHDLPPDGMTVNISRITTATSVALQSSENSAVSNTDIDDTLLTENVQTAAGQQVVSRQALERGTGIEGVVVDDLFRRWGTALDSTLINQATTGLSAVATSVAYTDASPTGPELYPKLLAGASQVEGALLGFGAADLAVMHSRRWNWMQSQMTTSWPMVGQPNIPTQAAGVNLAERYGSGVRGVLPNGLAVIVDNNIATNLGAGTNEDEIYVVPSSECHLWEDPQAPVMIRAEQPAVASLGVLIVLYGYFAYSFRRFGGGTAKIGGTGLVTPSF